MDGGLSHKPRMTGKQERFPQTILGGDVLDEPFANVARPERSAALTLKRGHGIVGAAGENGAEWQQVWVNVEDATEGGYPFADGSADASNRPTADEHIRPCSMRLHTELSGQRPERGLKPGHMIRRGYAPAPQGKHGVHGQLPWTLKPATATAMQPTHGHGPLP